MILKLKALVYRLTHIYLADKEERTYITSVEGVTRIRSLMDTFQCSAHSATGIAIGAWQVEHGFYKRLTTKQLKGIK